MPDINIKSDAKQTSTLGKVKVLVEQVVGSPSQEAITQAVEDYIESHPGSLSPLSPEVKAALLQIAEKVAYIDENGQDYYDALDAALSAKALLQITAVYTQTSTVYDTDSLDSLKADLVVTAYYDDGTTADVTSASVLSGTLAEGTSTVTVTYQEKTATFNVTVSVSYVTDGLVAHFDAINNTGNGHDSSATTWKDLVGTYDLTTLTGGTWSDNALNVSGANSVQIRNNSIFPATSASTIEMVIEPESSATQIVGSYNVQNSTVSKRFIIYSDNTVGFVGTSGNTYANSESALTAIRTMTAVYSGYTVSKAFVNNTQVSLSSNSHSFRRSKVSYILLGNTDSTDGNMYPFKGKIMSLRVYNRALSDSEIAQNHTVDIQRFGLE